MRWTILAHALALGLVTGASADEPKALPPPKPGCVILDLHGPPKDKKCNLHFVIGLEGLEEPYVCPISYSSYDPCDADIMLVGWQEMGFVVEKISDSQIRFVGWKGKEKDAKLVRVTGLAVWSKHLPPDRLPKVLPDGKNKG